jgi:PAS domain S-box-containing protein
VRKTNRAAQRELAERKRVEAALKESESRYRALIDMCPDSFVLTDLKGTYVMCNQQTANLMEAESSGDLLGTSVFERITGADREKAEILIQDAAEAEVVHNLEFNLKTLRGHQFPAEINAALLRDADGRPSGIIGLTRDITKRKEAEGVLKRSNAELRAINAIHVALNTNTDLSNELADVIDEVRALLPDAGLWFHIHASGDKDQRKIEVERGIEGVDASKQFQFLVDEYVFELKAPIAVVRPGDSPIMLHDDEVPPFCQAIGLPLMVQGDAIGVLGALIAEENDGQDHPFRAVDLRFLRTVSWRVSLAVENIRLTQEAADAHALRELNRMRSDLIANFSHNLKTPLGLIKMSCTTLMREDADFDTSLQREMLQDIDAQTDRLASIVDRVLELGQLESGKLRLRRQSADLVSIVERNVSSMRKSLNGHRLVCDLSEVSLPVYVDVRRIEEVLHNLLNNAVKYSPAGTDVTVICEREEACALVTIADQGIGIPDEDLQQIFERFYRVDNARTREVEGTGLGLAVSRSIIRAHGGRIWAENNADGGTTFRFTIPLDHGG